LKPASFRWLLCAGEADEDGKRPSGAFRAASVVGSGAELQSAGEKGTKGPAIIAGLEISNIQAMIFHHHGQRALS
jgi:hypothetical protein